MAKVKQTPMMEQYMGFKKQYPDKIPTSLQQSRLVK